VAQHVPDVGCRWLVDLITAALGSDLTIHLYKAPHTPAAGDTVADYVEADYEGYAPQPATAWTAAATVVGVTSSFANQLTFEKGVGGAGNDVYGYFATNLAGDVLVWAESDPDAPIDMNTDGRQYLVTPRFRLGSAP
jgi:hypothetical protein